MKGNENMLQVTACSYVKEGCVEEFLAVTKELVEKTNTEPGCIKYELCRDVNDPLCFIMVEEWADQKALDDHMKMPHCNELIPKLQVLSSKPAVLTVMEKLF
jgi:quinol monooxygenase YgiN